MHFIWVHAQGASDFYKLMYGAHVSHGFFFVPIVWKNLLFFIHNCCQILFLSPRSYWLVHVCVISGTHRLKFLTKALHIPITYMAVFKRVRRKELNEQARRNIKGQLGLIYSGIYPGIFDIDYFTGLPTNFKTVPLGLRKG